MVKWHVRADRMIHIDFGRVRCPMQTSNSLFFFFLSSFCLIGDDGCSLCRLLSRSRHTCEWRLVPSRPWWSRTRTHMTYKSKRLHSDLHVFAIIFRIWTYYSNYIMLMFQPKHLPALWSVPNYYRATEVLHHHNHHVESQGTSSLQFDFQVLSIAQNRVLFFHPVCFH